jgi:gamma-glutamyl-gamma-aminobutyrate hydrolase PuuD
VDRRGRPWLALRSTYVEALAQAGAQVLVVAELGPGGAGDGAGDGSRPAAATDPAALEEEAVAALAGLAGLVLPGGGDLDPRHYGEAVGPELRPLDEDLGSAQLALARAARALGLPTLGICLGAQVLNVACGGTLVQHLPDPAARHRPADGGEGDVEHEVQIEAGSWLARAVGAERARVRSAHHQAIARPGHGLRPTAWADDGVIEAVEGEGAGGALVVGVQWHPERGLAEPTGLRLLAAFVAGCR